MALKLNHISIDFTQQGVISITRTQVINLATLISSLDGSSDIKGTANVPAFTDTEFLTALESLNTRFPNFIINQIPRT